ncbi:hypothetical protein [Dietzia psychralcaliphila]|uniref:Uncharacterized protein n=1 Tax=Dietzia psychralcaliphila TaxID=139021 RepID=A0AAD0NP02_9ACTN|nr:hypothetical protein [Dietzia psychralcaliphila]AWH96521.1 hypothetical protein A6048_14635 [Dietzia psychralcaliphila]PTM90314.1 hypothetical protein C8N39_10167 [Dietzia psychralcaliphila]
MAPRQTARRLMVAVPALALAFAVSACTPPNEQPADPDAPYTLPTYTEEPGSEAEADAEEAAVEDAEDEAAVDGEEVVVVEVPVEEQPVEGQADPAAPPAQPAP